VPRHKKPAGAAVDKRNGRQVELQRVAGERFDPPDGLCGQALEQWERYWDDPVSQVHTKADQDLLRRWIANVDRYWRLIREADEQPLTRNSQGQVANPLYAVALKVEASVKADEAQLGIGPKNRAALGIAVVAEQRSLADMNARYSGGANGGTDRAEDEEDPRLQVIRGEVEA
jgi:P27 family predicted phage terminase small subunit